MISLPSFSLWVLLIFSPKHSHHDEDSYGNEIHPLENLRGCFRDSRCCFNDACHGISISCVCAFTFAHTVRRIFKIQSRRAGQALSCWFIARCAGTITFLADTVIGIVPGWAGVQACAVQVWIWSWAGCTIFSSVQTSHAFFRCRAGSALERPIAGDLLVLPSSKEHKQERY